MSYIRTTYIEFLCPGFFKNETWTREVKTRDLSKVKVPDEAYGFRFFDILSTIVKVDGEQVRLTSDRINVSPMHYYGGKIYTIAELERDLPDKHNVISNIKSGGRGAKAIHCRVGEWWLPFNETDIFIEVTP